MNDLTIFQNPDFGRIRGLKIRSAVSLGLLGKMSQPPLATKTRKKQFETMSMTRTRG